MIDSWPLPCVKRLPANVDGRDFIVGDLHGMMALLDALLRQVQFNPAVDRLLSVGDLVDRGRSSHRVVELMTKPWFHAVRGNHEHMLAHFTSSDETVGSGHIYGRPGSWTHSFIGNGGEWFLGLQEKTPTLARSFSEWVKALPHVIVVGEGPTRYNIVHSELAYDMAVGPAAGTLSVCLDADIDDGFQAPELNAERYIVGYEATGRLVEALLWGRRMTHFQPFHGSCPEKPVGSNLPGLSPTYCGHTILSSPTDYMGHRRLDTGAYKRSGRLTLVEASTGALFQIGLNHALSTGLAPWAPI